MSEWIEDVEYSEELDDASATLELLSDASDAGKRADVFLSEKSELTRSAAARLCEEGRVSCLGRAVGKKDKVTAGALYSVAMPAPTPDRAEPEDIPIHIVYEDDDLVVVHKPKGMVVHPAAGNPTGTLVNALLYHCKGSLSGIGGVIRPGIVHRIDKDTEGLLVVAKNDASHLYLAERIKTHEIRRIYYAIVQGNFREDSGTVDAPIGRHPVDRKRMAVVRDPAKRARDAVTHFTVVERLGRFSLVRCELETGRTHQIRVHLSSIGHPLLGDTLYGGGGTAFEKIHAKLLQGQCLVAAKLMLTHPKNGAEMTFEIPLPEDFEKLLALLRKECE